MATFFLPPSEPNKQALNLSREGALSSHCRKKSPSPSLPHFAKCATPPVFPVSKCRERSERLYFVHFFPLIAKAFFFVFACRSRFEPDQKATPSWTLLKRSPPFFNPLSENKIGNFSTMHLPSLIPKFFSETFSYSLLAFHDPSQLEIEPFPRPCIVQDRVFPFRH